MSETRAPGPRVTAFVTAYNAERFIAETLASVRRQTMRDLEIIVADDGSTDGTVAVAQQPGDPPARIVTGPNVGIGGNMARAFPYCRGEFVAFVAGDDRWRPHHLARALEALDREPAAALTFARAGRIDDQGVPIEFSPSARKRRPRSGRVEPIEILRANFIDPYTLVVRRRAIEEVGGLDPSMWLMEFDLLVRLVSWGPVIHIPEITADYRLHAAGMSRCANGMRDGRIAVLEKHLPASPLRRQLIAETHIRAARHRLWPYPTVADTPIARRDLVAAVRLWPGLLKQPMFLLLAATASLGRFYVMVTPQLRARLTHSPVKLRLQRLLRMTA